MKIAILTNGEYGNYDFCKHIKEYQVIICADNGMKHAKVLGIMPNYIVGDFDSGNEEDLKYFPKAIVERVNKEKDETDTELAVDLALGLKPHQIDIFGGLGTRMDHSLGNVHLLYKGLLEGVCMRLMHPHNVIYLINDKIVLHGEIGDLVSLLPLSMHVEGVYTKGLAYEVINGDFYIGKPYGISNYMSETTMEVVIQKGLLLVMKVRD
jgi:thiamine pyrophosphokinase